MAIEQLGMCLFRSGLPVEKPSIVEHGPQHVDMEVRQSMYPCSAGLSAG